MFSITETICNQLVGQNFTTQHSIYTCLVLISLVPCPLRKDTMLTHNWKRTHFALPLSKGYWGKKGRKNNIQPKYKCLECCSCSFTRHNPNPGKKSGILPLTSKRCSFNPHPVPRTPCSVSPHSGTLPTHFPKGNLQVFFPLSRYPRAFHAHG